jgi:hypothetical protein
MSKPEPEPQPKRGAPPGNKNALKHGFYSRALTEQEQREASASTDRFRDEINLLKVLVYRIARRLKPSDGKESALSFHEYLNALQVLSLAISRLYRFYYIKKKVSPPKSKNQSRWVEAFKGMGFPNVEEDVEQEMADEYRQRLGARLGNTNALKHGFYSPAFKSDELRRLDAADQSEIIDEVTLLRTLIKRLVVSMGETTKLELLDELRAARVITFALACVEHLENLVFRINKIPFSTEEILEKSFFDAIKEVADSKHLSDRFDLDAKRTIPPGVFKKD